MATALALPAALFTAVIVFPSRIPPTYVQGIGLTPFKRDAEYLIIGLLAAGAAVYGIRMHRTADRQLISYVAALIMCVASGLALAVHTRVFDTWNILGHVDKLVAFSLVYRGLFITSIRDPYARLAEAGERIGRLNVELEERVRARTAELEAANRELDSFSSSVSHDLRAPLRTIGSFTQLIESRHAAGLSEEGRSLFGLIRDAESQMERLIEGLLKLARLSRGALTRTRLDLSGMARRIGEGLAADNRSRTVELVVADGLTADADEVLMTAVLQNLLGNAWKFTAGRPGARVEVGREEVDGRPAFFVRDNGAGFDIRYVDKLFRPFERLHPASDFPGAGIGLATVQRIVERHGGRVWAEGAVGTGATVHFTL
jgi:signal transduction histidine kinase